MYHAGGDGQRNRKEGEEGTKGKGWKMGEEGRKEGDGRKNLGREKFENIERVLFVKHTKSAPLQEGEVRGGRVGG